MSGVLRGLNQRTKGNIESETKFDINSVKNQKTSALTDQNKKKESLNSENSNDDSIKNVSNKKGNQYAQVKISKSLKNELEAIKIIEKTKFDYEVLQLLIDSYVRNELSAANRKKFNLFLEMNDE